MTRKATTTTTAAPDTQAAAAAPAANDNASTALTTSQHDELAGLDLGESDDGLGEIDQEDIRVATMTLNAKRTDARGRQIGADMFFNTITETVHEEIDAAFLLLHKTNAWTWFNQTENRSEVMCSSRDRKTGLLRKDGANLERPCEGCPDAQWREVIVDGEKKRKRNCSVFYNVFSVDRVEQQLFVIRFKRTSLPAFKTHLQKHHIGRRIVAGKRVNYPLYAFSVKLTGKMASPTATYALPVIQRTGVLSAEEIQMCAMSVDALKAQMSQILDKVEAADVEQSDADDSKGGDASFDSEKYSGAVGEDFTTTGA